MADPLRSVRTCPLNSWASSHRRGRRGCSSPSSTIWSSSCRPPRQPNQPSWQRKGRAGRDGRRALFLGCRRRPVLGADRGSRRAASQARRHERLSRSRSPRTSTCGCWPRRHGAARTSSPRCCASGSTATTPETSACLYLLADPATAGEPGGDRSGRASRSRDRRRGPRRLRRHQRPDRAVPQRSRSAPARAVDVYVPLHAGCAGHLRLAARAGSAVVQIGGDDLAKLVGIVTSR